MSVSLPPLPDGWNWTTVADVGATSEQAVLTGPFGTSLGPDDFVAQTASAVPVLTIGCLRDAGIDLRKATFVRPAKAMELERYRLRAGDILFSRMATVGRAGLVRATQEASLFNYHIMRLRLRDDAIDPLFFIHYVRSSEVVRAYVRSVNHGMTRDGINTEQLVSMPLPVAPRNEQRRIVEAIEDVQSRLDAAVANLEAAQRRLNAYRASVLKAAVEGRLVPTEAETARKEGRSYEAADVLLERILKERRRSWECAELAKMNAAGKTPKDDKWKVKYEAPVPHDITGLPNLPQGWCWATLDAFLTGIDAGKNFSCEERPPSAAEIGVVKVSAVTWGTFDENESKTCTRRELANLNHLIRPGDFLFSRANTLELVGACVIAGQFSRTLLLSDKILRLRLLGEIDRWLMWVLRSYWGRREIESLASGNQLSMRNLSQDNLRRLRIPLPPLAEIERIVDQIDVQFSIAEETAAIVSNCVNRAKELRQAVLRLAFDGQLVDRDPADEPAEVLLARIRTERAARVPATHGKKSGRKLRAVS